MCQRRKALARKEWESTMEQDTTGEGVPVAARSADAAASVLRDVQGAQTQARLRARLVPAWYGPATGIFLAVYVVVAQRLLEADKGFVQLWLAYPVAGLVVVAFRRAARRSRGVTQLKDADFRAGRRQRRLMILAPTVLAAGLVWGIFRALGAGDHVAVSALAVAVGLSMWVGFARYNLAIRRQLREQA
ncbi:hypothetical protein [Streptomyces iconiensis]|uniref:Integral membrane protein n=1 Tax=Streptomyces iconiensis TaxID=1384038 RepID=A0ABT6ZYX7_9ACTN|nr:hypothetical protein [Streptomyces iconiensis]MDJ1134273.1 hypothetical protein [Streptomyces iconiensis]